jgi:putative transposase
MTKQVEKTTMNKLFHCVFSLHYHLVICTKYRRKCLTSEMLTSMRAIVEQRCHGWSATLNEFNGEADHVHMLLSMPPNLDLSRFVNNLKTTTSRLLRRDFSERLRRYYSKPVFWSRSYCVISCGGAPLSVIKQYIEQQARPA